MDKEIIVLPQAREQLVNVIKWLNEISDTVGISHTPELHYVITNAITSCRRAEEIIQSVIDTAVKNDI